VSNAKQLSHFVLASLWTALACKVLLFVYKFAVNVPFSDQWQTFTPLFEAQSYWQIFTRQHGPHRLGVGFLLEALILKASRWNIIYESYFTGGVLILTSILALALLYRIKRNLTLMDLGMVGLILSPLHYETLLLVPSAYHSIIPLLLTIGLGFSFCLNTEGWHFGLGTLLTVASIFTGFGVIAGCVVPAFYFFNLLSRMKSGERSKLFPPILALSVIASAWGLFFLDYTFATGAGELAPSSFPISSYLSYLCMMLSGVLQLSGWPGVCAGSIVLLCSLLVTTMLLKKTFQFGVQFSAADNVCLFFTTTGLLYGVLTTLGRIQLGEGFAQSSRYMALLVPVYFGIYLHIVSLSQQKLKTVLQVWFAAVIFISSFSLTAKHQEVLSGFQKGKRDWILAYKELHNLELANQKAGFNLVLATQERLDFLERNKLSFFSDTEHDLTYDSSLKPWGNYFEWSSSFVNPNQDRQR